jgi:exodeoxyribonuclease V alpha subunit
VKRDAARLLADAFAARCGEWSRRAGADAATQALAARAAFEVSLATSAGHVCAHLDALGSAGEASDAATLRDRLLASGIVGTPAAPGTLPLILDADGRLYLHRYYDYERRLAHRLHRCGPAPVADPAALKTRLEALFAANAARLGGRVDWQKLAAANALLGRLTVISGGPGTGKTTTVVALLACLLEQQPDARVALAAPTGKAAARLIEAIGQRAAGLPDELRARLPQQAHTVHRLLGATAEAGRFRHDAAHPLALDALIVDEASMLDLALATRLFEAVPPSARIVLLGDKDQLSAVESGAVFAELSADPARGAARAAQLAALCSLDVTQLPAPPAAAAGGLADSVIWFRDNFRFAADSGIGRLAADINGGRAAAAVEWLAAGAETAVRWLADGSEAPEEASVTAIDDGYATYRDAVRRHAAGDDDRAAVIAAFDRFRVLCAMRSGARGVEAVNRLIARRFRRALAHPQDAGPRHDEAEWYQGRPVMVLQNDYALRLANGDIGIALPHADGRLMVCFPDRERGVREVAPARMPAHETAFAMTVHKSQGSEFDEVLLMLPAEGNRVLTRELLYTAVTRARSRVGVVGAAEVLGFAIAARTRRHSGLLARLAEINGA